MREMKRKNIPERKNPGISIVIVLILAVLVAGCAEQKVKTVPDDGLKITDYTIDRDEVGSGESFALSVLVENLGGTTATDVEVDIFGVSWLPENKVVLFSGKTLRPPQPELNIQGGVALGAKRISAPQLPEGISHKFPLLARAYYDYKSTAIARIPVMTEAEFDREKLRGATLPTLVVENTHAAPIKIDMTGGVPIIADTGEFFFKIYLKNTGTGIPITNDVTGLVAGDISIVGAGKFAECFGQKEGKSITLPENRDEGVLLRRGESVTIPCSISLQNWGQIPRGELLIDFRLSYRYYTEAEQSVLVHGKKIKAGGEVTPETGTCEELGGSCVRGGCFSGTEQVSGYCPGREDFCCRATEASTVNPGTVGTPPCVKEGGLLERINEACCPGLVSQNRRCVKQDTCGFLPKPEGCDPTRQQCNGLYRTWNPSKPFGNWPSADADKVKQYFNCISGCNDIFISAYNAQITRQTPIQYECKA